MKSPQSVADMTDAEFERYLKRHRLTGMGAVAASRQRRALIESRKTAEITNGATITGDCPVQLDAGEVCVNQFNIEARSDNVVAIYGDLHTKRAVVEGHINSDDMPGILLGATFETLKTDEAKAGQSTAVYFPTFKGWRVHCADVSRYTVAVCLVKQG